MAKYLTRIRLFVNVIRSFLKVPMLPTKAPGQEIPGASWLMRFVAAIFLTTLCLILGVDLSTYGVFQGILMT